jgi:hypothetical protein
MISDNCIKHNKTYLTHVFIANWQVDWNQRQVNNNNNTNRKMTNRSNNSAQNPKKIITFHTLGPGDAHNQCDASIAHVKRALRRIQSVCSLLETTNHLAYSYSRFQKKNFHLIEVFSENFPKYLELEIPIPFILKSYDISYNPPVMEMIKCNHNCKRCAHECCRNDLPKKVYHFDCKDKDGNENKYKIIVKGEVEKDPNELDSLDETDFYKNSETRAKNLKVKNKVRSNFRINIDHVDENEYDGDDYEERKNENGYKRKKRKK